MGVGTATDLVFREAPVHPPSTFDLFALVLTFGQKRTHEDLRRIGASTSSELMSLEVVKATSSTPILEVAGWMADKQLSMVPVVDEGNLVGVITRRGMVRHTLTHYTKPSG